MKKYLFLLMLPFCLAACNDDDPEPGLKPDTPVNPGNNGNTLATTFVSEGGITKQQAVARLEMPKLKAGAMDLFVVHTVGDKVNYAIEYDCDKRASRWTAYQWYKGMSSNEQGWNRNSWRNTSWKGDPFQPDPLIPAQYALNYNSFSGSGYQRGHMLGSADRLNSQDINEQTFYMSNMHPQSANFNAGDNSIWYALESRLRSQYDKDSFRDTLYVVKGGTIADGQFSWIRSSSTQLVCPNYFFIAILCKNKSTSQGGYKAIGFWMPHTNNTTTQCIDYAVSIDRLEELTGIDFFCNLPDNIETVVERNLVTTAWKL